MTTRRIEAIRDDPFTTPHAEGVLVIDETGDRKDGTHTAHVGYQYLGSMGKMAKGIVAVTSLWADEGVYYPLHVRPSTPAARLAGAKQHPAFRTKPRLAQEVVHAARAVRTRLRYLGPCCGLALGRTTWSDDLCGMRLVEESEDANRSRWPMDPTWHQLREAFGQLADVPPLDDEKRTLVRGAHYRGRMRLLRRMEAGVIRSLEVEDASPTSTALMTMQRWMERVAEKEMERITAKCRRYQEQGKPVPAWVRAGMDERFRRVEQIEQRIQMLLGIFASHGVLPLEFKPAYSVGDLLLQYLDALEQEAEEKGGVQQVLADHFAKVYKVTMSLAA